MTEPSASPSRGDSPGALLRQARQQQGVELDTLAAAIKVRPEKLAALESDRYDQLPDMAFTRALAKTLCRTLKIDAAPVLAGLPSSIDGERLEQVATGLNTPFRERAGRHETRDWGPLKRPLLWAVALLLLGAAAIVLMPAEWFRFGSGATSETPEAAATTGADPAASGVVETLITPSTPPAADTTAPAPAPATPASVPASTPAAAATPAVTADTTLVAAATSGLLVMRASAQSWVEVRNSANQVLLSRALQAGETVNLDGAPPLRATIGNAAATAVSFRGQALDLRSQARDNVARLELK
ncbi:helix-turn-helix domain-containing protein [Azohydromonas caseinilytica]|uniref:Helix-turn-helix domain-containing protein n=1 Tax=Azohydromonas caseinilytica TaxID=2728836 RepID=A0A848F6F8_9BURK|nr:helix-turn-helix domain-containing protein [Azohydromonas caseinilytica]NML14276.1 helix-turn-helix domain-containing protein [Azohydromonas caseinilytica]